MKMNFKLSMVAGALALAVAAQANAAIVDMTAATGSDLVLTVWDQTSNTSYTRDLGINMSSFVAGVSGTTTTLAADSTAVGNLSFAADANLTSYLGTTAATDSVVWSVTAGRNFGGTGFMGQQYLSTTNATNVAAQANSTLKNFTGVNGYYTGASSLMAAGATSVGGVTTGDAYAGGFKMGTNWATKSVFDDTAAVGSSLNFWFLTPSSTSTVAKAAVAQFGGTGVAAATWTLAANGALTYNTLAVSAVPEPGEWLLMLGGIGLIGFIASRRKNHEGSMMNFA